MNINKHITAAIDAWKRVEWKGNEADLSEGLNDEAEEKSEKGDSSIGVES